MTNANTYQKEQRYEEALGQLQLLLAIDPLNDEALMQKQTLEDLISFRKDLEVQKERSVEKVNLLRETDASKIPYAEEMTHPKNWAELISKRGPDAIVRAESSGYGGLYSVGRNCKSFIAVTRDVI